MKKHRAFWREVRKRAFAWLLVCLLVIGIVKPLEYGYATSSGEPQNVAETILEGGEENQSGQEDSDIIIETLSEEESESDLMSVPPATQTPAPEIADGEPAAELNNTPANEAGDVSEDPENIPDEELGAGNEENGGSTEAAPSKSAPMKKEPLKAAPAPKGIDWSTFTFDDIADPDSFDWMGIDWAAINPGIVNWNKVKWLKIDLSSFLDAYDTWENFDEIDTAIMASSSFDDFIKAMGLDEVSPYDDLLPFPLGLKVDLSLWNVDEYGNKKTEIQQNGNSISNLDQNLMIQFDFSSGSDASLYDVGLRSYDQESKEYELTLPEWFSLTTSSLTKELDDNLGRLIIEDGKAKVRFNKSAIQDFSAANAGLTCKINPAKASDANEEGILPIVLTTTKTINLKVDSLVAKGPKIEKKINTNQTTATIGTSGIVEWTVTYTKPTSNYTGTKVTCIEDAIPTGMTYVGISGTLPSGVSEDTTDSQKIKFNIDDSQITGDSITFKYTTKLTDEYADKMMKGETSTFPNTVTMKNGDTDLGNSTATATTPTTPYKSITKAGGTFNASTQTMEWTVIVNTFGASFSDLTLTDTMGKYLGLEKITINGTDTTLPTVTTSGDQKSFSLDLKSTTPDANGQITVKYETKVDASFWTSGETSTSEGLKNEASLNWTTTSGQTGSGTAPKIGPLGLSTEQIKKEPVNMNFSGSVIDGKLVARYYITVNENKLPLAGTIKVKDVLENGTTEQYKGHFRSAPSISSSSNSNVGIDSITYYKDKSFTYITTDLNEAVAFEATLSNIDNQTCKILVEVDVTDDRFYAENSSGRPYRNTASLFKNDVQVGNESTTENRFSFTHYAKHVRGFDPDTKEILWCLYVNQNTPRAILGEINITDVIPAGLQLTEAYIQREDQSTTTPHNYDSISPGTYDITTPTTVKWTVNVTDAKRYDLFYKTKIVDTDNMYNLDKVFSNTAFFSKTGTTPVPYTATATFKPNSIKKEAVLDSSSNEIHYTVKLNPYSLNIKNATNLILRDTLNSNLLLDETSVKLYKAKVTTPNTTSNSVVFSDDKYTYSYTDADIMTPKSVSYENNVLTITLPDNADKESYVVTYTAYAMSYGNLDNTIEITGVPTSVSQNQDIEYVAFSAAAYGGATKRVPPAFSKILNLKKVDKDGIMITSSSVKITLYKSETGGEEDKIKDITFTGAGMIALKASDLDGVDTVWVEETTPPSLYKGLAYRIPISIADLDKELVLTNYKDTDIVPANAVLKVKKVTDDGVTFLPGARVTLYSDEACEHEVGSEREITSSGAEFTGLTAGQRYYLKETTTPTGYITAQVVPVVAGINLEYTIINQLYSDATKVIIKKVKEDGTFLSDSQFTIYKDVVDEAHIATGSVDGNPIGDLKDLDIMVSGGITITGLSEGTYYLEETKVPSGYSKAPIETFVIDALHLTYDFTVVNKKKAPDPPGGIGGDGPDDSSTPETTAPPVKPAVKTDANGNKLGSDGKIPQTGQLWWPVWLMGGLGSLFLILGFLWRPKKKK